MNQLFRTSAKRTVIGALLVIAIVCSSIVQPVFATTTQRNTAISTMSSMRYFSWKPNGDVTIYSKTYLSYVAYTGLPYTQNANTTLSGFISSPTMMWFSGGGYFLSQPSDDIGNDCSSAVAISWSAGGSSIIVSDVWTPQMLRAVKATENKMAKRGTYTTTYDYTYSMAHSQTKEILYGALVPGDGCFYKTSSGGHAILITGVNTSTKKVTYIEQIGTNLSTNKSTWTSGDKTFQQLYDAGYVPIRPTDI